MSKRSSGSWGRYSAEAEGGELGGVGAAVRRRRFGRRGAAARLLGAGLAVALASLGAFVPASSAPSAAGAGVLFFRPAVTPAVVLPAPGVVVTPSRDVPDPYVIGWGGLYFMFFSQDGFAPENVPMIVSNSLTSWQGPAVDAMPVLPPWASPGFTWSPDVLRVGQRYVMWFNAGLASSGSAVTKCIGVATSRTILGPYRSNDPAPLVCQLDHLGSIDPRVFTDPSGRLWLLWKSDENAAVDATSHTTIYAQQLTADGLRLLGSPVALMTADLPWEGRIVESPDMVYASGHYWLFFSGNWFNEPAYAMGVAECLGPTGPCEPTSLGPWFGSNAQGSGPGEESLFNDGSRWWMFYAPFAIDYTSTNPRPAAVVRLEFGPDGPVVVAPGTAAWSAPDPVPKAKPLAEKASVTNRRGKKGGT